MKVRPRDRTIGGTVYKDYVVLLPRIDGQRGKVKVFPTREAADLWISEKQDLVDDHGRKALAIDPSDAKRYAAAEIRLAAAGGTIERAVDYFLEHHRPVKEHVTLATLLDRCVLDMELRQVRGNSIKTFTCACRSFLEGRSARDPATVTRDEIRSWIYGNKWEPKTQRSYMQAIGQLLSWAVERQHLASSPLGRGAIKLPRLVKKEPKIFTVHQLERLFRTAWSKHELAEDPDTGERRQLPVYRRLIGYLALATFGGIRPFELTRLEIEALDLDGLTATLDANVTKMSDRRVVDLTENCVAWLRPWLKAFPKYKHPAPPSWDRLLKGLRKAAGLIPWPHDVLRHCFASYFHATHGDKKKLQDQLGHSESEDTLEKHYRAVRGPDGKPVTKLEAAKFWKLSPRALGLEWD